MAIITVIQRKGGVGKTTLAVNLAGELVAAGRSVVLLDADPQQSIMRGWMPRGERRGLLPKIARTADHSDEENPVVAVNQSIDAAAAEADFVVIDTAPSFDSRAGAAAYRSDLALVPFSPSLLDVQSALDLVAELEAFAPHREAEGRSPLKIALVPAIVNSQAVLTRRVLGQLDDAGQIVLRSIARRIANQEAVFGGLTTREYGQDEHATAEWRALAKQVRRLL